MPYFGRYGVKAYLREVDSWLQIHINIISTLLPIMNVTCLISLFQSPEVISLSLPFVDDRMNG